MDTTENSNRQLNKQNDLYINIEKKDYHKVLEENRKDELLIPKNKGPTFHVFVDSVIWNFRRPNIKYKKD